MNIDIESLEKVNSGGGDLYILGDEESNEIISGASIDNEQPKYIEILAGKWEIVKKDSMLKIAMQKNPYTRNRWWGLVVVNYQNKYQRVDLQVGKCSQCDWEGWTATPLSFDLYIGTTDEASEFFDEAKNLPVLSCPKCNGKLDKHAIWVEKK